MPRASAESDTTAVDQNDQAAPISPQTTFEQILGPVTATEQTGRDMVAQQRAEMFQSRSRSPSRSNKSSTKKGSGKFLGKIKTAIKAKKSKTNLRPLNISKPLPVVPGADQGSLAAGFGPNLLTMPSPGPPRPERPASPLSPEDMYFSSPGNASPARTAPINADWPLPASSSPAVPARPVAAAAPVARAALPSGMILSTPGRRVLAPAREGGYASVQTPTVVAPAASATVASLRASLAEEGGVGAAAGEEGEKMVAEMTVGELREVVREELEVVRDELGEVMGALAGLSAEMAALRRGLERVEGLAREEKARSACSGRYPGRE